MQLFHGAHSLFLFVQETRSDDFGHVTCVVSDCSPSPGSWFILLLFIIEKFEFVGCASVLIDKNNNNHKTELELNKIKKKLS